MPLCGEKKWRPAAFGTADEDGDILHTIELTGERFGQLDDFKKRMAEYNERKWTCQATGKHNLTFEEAFKSEEEAQQQTDHLFTPSMKKALLFFIHHSFLKENNLVEGVQKILKKTFFEGEEVKMNLKQTVVGRVETICKEKEGSPTSDKENQKKYDVRTLGSGNSNNNKLVRGVPHDYLERKTPLTEADISQFIALCATRTTSSSPWVVSADLKTTYDIKDKVHSLFASSPASVTKARATPVKHSEKTASEKKVDKLEKKTEKSEKKKEEEQKTPQVDRPLPSTSSDESDEDVPLVRRSQGVPPVAMKAKKQLKRLSKGSSIKKKAVDLNSSKSTKKEPKAAEVRRQSSGGKKTVVDYFKSAAERRDSDQTASDSDDFVTIPRNKKSQLSSASLSPAKQMQKRFDATIQRLEAHLAKHQVKLYNVAIALAAKSFTAEQIDSVQNEQIRRALLKSKALSEEQEILSKMTEAEKSEYLAEKAAKLKLEQRNRRIEAAKLANLKYEDTSLENLEPLPDLDSVAVPDSVPASCFGDALMVTEFVHRFRDLLGDDSSDPISAERLLMDMTLGERGYMRTTARVLEALLHTLLQDDVAKNYETLCTKLNTLTTNTSTAAELARLALRRKDDDLADLVEDDEEEPSDGRRSRSQTPSTLHANDIDDAILVSLERSEFYELSVSDQMTVLLVLVGRLLDCYSINEFVETFQQRIDSAAEDREKIRLEVDELRKRKAEMDAEIAANKEELSSEQRETTPNGDRASPDAPPTPDMKAKLQKYRQEKAQAAVEAQRRRKMEERQRRLQKIVAEMTDAQARLQSVNDHVKELELEKGLVKRVPALGTDRIHRRYYFFRNGANPGLYIEDGWVSKETLYSCFDPLSQTTPARKEDITNFCERIAEISEPAQQTFPEVGANRWYKIASTATFDALFAALHAKGEREAALKLTLNHARAPISDSISVQQQKTEQKIEDDEDSADEFAASFKQTLEETGRAIRESGFGGIEDIDLWLGRLASANSVSQLIELLFECQQSIHDRFLRGRMKGASHANKETDAVSNGNGEVPASKLLARWVELVKQCTTVSRLHVLLYVFDSYIDWDKSTKHQKCRTCRKKKDTEHMLLCDDCNDGYHMYCLRPKLTRMPRGDWFCRGCKHKHERKVRYTDEEEDEDDEVVGSRHEDHQKNGRHTANSNNRRRVYFSDDEDDDELEEKETALPTRRSKRNLEIRQVSIPLVRCADEPKNKRAKRQLDEEDEPSEMEELCTRIFKQISSSRACSSLFADLPEGVPSTRSRKQPVIHTLADIEKKLHCYAALDEMFADFATLLARAKDTLTNQPRKLAKLESVEQELAECAAQFTD
uniref:Bromodomain adjacent to zinc finger domain protein 1A n=1 Tax=Plectus sambesii TaxID=2011161 RepID=A0A914WXG0_9BILA